MNLLIAASLVLGSLADDAERPAEHAYRIHVWTDFVSHPRLSPGLKIGVRKQFEAIAQRYLGSAWELTFADRPAKLSPIRMPTGRELEELDLNADKLLWLRLETHAPGRPPDSLWMGLTVSEYDFRFAEWSGPSRHAVLPDERLGESVFLAAYWQFRPHAEIVASDSDGKIQIQLRGLALQPSGSPRPLAPEGLPFRIFREYQERDQPAVLNEIPYTYLIYRKPERDRLTAQCDLVSALRSPLSRRTRRRAKLLALGASQSASATTSVRFLSPDNEIPAVGLEVSLRPQDTAARVPVGTTDHQGRIVVRPVTLASEVGRGVPRTRMYELRLSAGDAVIASLPLIPGETGDLDVNVQLDPLLTEVSGQVVGLQDELLDAVVSRKVLGAQLESAAEEGDVETAKDLAEKLNRQPNLAYFESRLKQIKEDADKRRQEMERATLGGPIGRLFVQSENLLKKFGSELLDRKVSFSETAKAQDADAKESE